MVYIGFFVGRIRGLYVDPFKDREFVFLHESFTIKSALGCVLIGAGTLLMVL